jgi:hypothetical protein
MAKFWLRFLGCALTVEPRVATERFFEATLDFINRSVTDPVDKNDIYQHLQSQLKSERRTFSPRSFIEDYFPKVYRKQFEEHLKESNVSLTAFSKDISDITHRLRKRAFHTKNGVIVSVPAESSDLVEVTNRRITVNDLLLTVDHK